MNDQRIKISVVSYLNSKPFIYSLKKAQIEDEFDISLDIPSDCALKLLDGRVDIGLVPITIISSLQSPSIISEFCIAADGEVGSVLLLSKVSIEKIEQIFLDYQSKTSVQLAKILAEKFWNIRPKWLNAQPGYENLIEGNTAGIVIGDRALVIRNKFEYIYDLSSEWKKLTELPFVFACWVANKPIPVPLIEKLNKSLKDYEQQIPVILSELKQDGLTLLETESYLRKNIHYVLSENKRKGMDLFLSYLK